jgi:hypothetical protein
MHNNQPGLSVAMVDPSLRLLVLRLVLGQLELMLRLLLALRLLPLAPVVLARWSWHDGERRSRSL